MFYFIAIIWLVLDQASKYYVMNHFALGESIPVIHNVFHLTYIINRGAAFGMLTNQRWFFLVIAIALIALYVFFGRRLPRHWLVRSGVGLLLGGAVGNALDRFFMGAVTDFVDFHFWPVFNVADMGIVCGVALLLWYSWKHSVD